MAFYDDFQSVKRHCVMEGAMRPARLIYSAPVTMPLLSYFLVVGTVLLGIIVLSGIANGPPLPLSFGDGSQGLPQRSNQSSNIPKAHNVSPPAMTAAIIPQAVVSSETLVSAKLTNREKLTAKHKAKTE
jgi:hypothetical protein